MDVRTALHSVGLSEGEAAVYLSLLKLGRAPVSKIKEDTGLHRTTIYDFVEKLLNKGLVSYAQHRGAKHYQATHPQRLLDYVQEKEDLVKDILPALAKLNKAHSSDISVEVYRGIEGLKTFLNDMIRVGEDYVGFGVEEHDWESRIPEFVQQHFRREKELGIRGRALISEDARHTYDDKAHYRTVPREYFNPTTTAVYGDRTATVIWEPLTVIIVQNKDVADSHRKHFELLWKSAEER